MKKKTFIWLVATLVWTSIIFSFTLQPGNISDNFSGSILNRIIEWFAPNILNQPEKLNQLHNVLRKIAHFGEYFILCVLSFYTVKLWKEKYMMYSILYCFFIACVDETIQIFVPGRNGRVSDVLIDTCGALTVIVLLVVKRKISFKKLRDKQSYL